MALASYFLVTTDHEIAEIRSAGFLYLIVAHIGAHRDPAVLRHAAARAVELHVRRHARQHAVGRAGRRSHFCSRCSASAPRPGFVPVHVWLPEAHPAAPSPVSALMSGVMLKTAIYGLLRVTFDLLHQQIWWWGVVALALGLLTALFGVMFAAVQTDMKRLLAYSSIENIGIILVGIGLAILFHAIDMNVLAALALVATLYHCLNHALFKSLLFLVTGSVMHATSHRSLGKLGGLIRSMPWVAARGADRHAGDRRTAAAQRLRLRVDAVPGIPAHADACPTTYLNMLVPVGTAALALAVALAGYVMVKFYGVVFLGLPREELAQAHDAGPMERAGLLWLAVVVRRARRAAGVRGVCARSGGAHADHAASLEESMRKSSWLFLTAISPETRELQAAAVPARHRARPCW